MRKLKLIYISKGDPEQKGRHFVEDISLSKEFSRTKDFIYLPKKSLKFVRKDSADNRATLVPEMAWLRCDYELHEPMMTNIHDGRYYDGRIRG